MESSQFKLSECKPFEQQAIKNGQKLKKQQEIGVKQRKDSRCLLKEQNQATIRSQQNQMWQKQPQAAIDINFWKILLLGMTLAEFSIQISVIVIQYISSKISLLPFVASSCITLILVIFVLISLKILSISKIYHYAKASPQNEKPKQIAVVESTPVTPTLQKIRNNTQARMHQKTLKLKPLPNITPKKGGISQNLKQLQGIENEESLNQSSAFFSAISMHANMYLIIITKSIQMLFSLIACTICFCTIENPKLNGFSYIDLFLVFFYVLVAFSFAVLLCLSFKIQQNLLNPVQQTQNQQVVISIKKQCEIITNEGGHFQKTILSIDRYIPSSREDKNKKQKQSIKEPENIIKPDQKVTKIHQNIIKCDQDTENVKSNPNQLAENVPTQAKNVKKCLSHRKSQSKRENNEPQIKVIKKSMLKESRHFQTKAQAQKSGENSKTLHVQRRRVQINSKKIQYFEYANITPDNSERLSQEQSQPQLKSVCQKPKVFTQKNKSFQQKLMNEEKLLQRKRQENIKRASKSAKFVSSEKETQVKLKLSTSNTTNILNDFL